MLSRIYLIMMLKMDQMNFQFVMKKKYTFFEIIACLNK